LVRIACRTPNQRRWYCRPMHLLHRSFNVFIAFGAARTLALLTTTSTLVVCGCAQWGGDVLMDNHVAFNTSVAQAMDRQMLLNIIRLSMDEPTQWLTVSVINVNTTVSLGANGRTAIPSDGFVSGEAGGTTSFSYTPNITFVPRSGEQLANELMSPIPVTSIEHMVSASWPISWVLFLTCERMQDVSSFDVTRGFGVRAMDPRFGRLMQLFDELQKKQLVSLSQVPMPFVWNKMPIPPSDVNIDRVMDSKRDHAILWPRADGGFDYVSVENVPVLTLYPPSAKNENAQELLKILQLGQEPGNFRMVGLESQLSEVGLTVRTRSMTSMMRMLSFGVDNTPNAPPPPAEVDDPSELWSILIANSDESTDDLSTYVDAVFRVRRGERAPANASVAVSYRGEWFWIESSDKVSRQMFAMVRDMFDLQVSAGVQTQPLLTVPVGR